MSKPASKASVYIKFLNLVRALDDAPKFPELDPTEEKLLSQLAQAWHADKRVTVLDAMGMGAGVSSTTIHRRLKSLTKKRVISLEVDESDNRIKYVVPTPIASEYFSRLSRCMVAATKGTLSTQ